MSGKCLSVVLDAVVGGADPLVESEQKLPFDQSTPAPAKSCCSSDSHPNELKLVAVLPVLEDPAFKHAMLEANRGPRFHRTTSGS